MRVLYILMFLAVLSCKKKTEPLEITEVKDVADFNTKFEVYDYAGLKPLLNIRDDKVHVVNFWATWCAPCVKELPYFEKLNTKYKEDVEMLLVSLDFPKKYDTKLKPFLQKHQLKSKVVALNDTDQDTWIPAIDKDWSGAIPATLIYKGEDRQFYEGSFTYEELEKEVKQFLN